MKMTLDDTQQKDIETQRVDDVDEARAKYTAILDTDPNNLEANHNMGVLAFREGNKEDALEFFETALATNPTVGQIWLSYIDVLIDLNRTADAQSAFDLAKSKGIEDEDFSHLEKRLFNAPKSIDPPAEQLQVIIDIYSQGQFKQALLESSQTLQSFPNSAVLYNISGASNAGLMQFDAAIKNYEQSLKINPGYDEAYNNIGIALSCKGNFEQAIENFLQALKINPTYAEAYNNLGNAQSNQGDHVSASKSFRQALEVKPNYAEAYNNIGNCLQLMGHFDEALESFNQALNLIPLYSQAQYNKAITLTKKGDLEAAIKSYNQAIQIKPDHAEAHYNLGVTHSNLGDQVAAISSFNAALHIDPNFVEAYNNIGIALNENGDPSAALEFYKRALEIKPDQAQVYNNMGVALNNKGDSQAAIGNYQLALKINPDYAEAHVNLGHLLDDKGDLQAALDSYEKALLIQPDQAESYYSMGKTQSKMGNLVAAIQSYKRAVSVRPDYAEAYLNMGSALQDQGEFAAALLNFNAALAINPDYAEAYNNMGLTLFDMGDLKAAIDNYNKALLVRPDFAEAYYNKATALVENGAFDAAIESYEIALKIRPEYEAARASKLRQQSNICDWEGLAQDQDLIAKLGISKDYISPYAIQSLEDSPERQQLRSENFSKALYGNIIPLPPTVKPLQKPKRLRIGYFSADFHEHPVAYLMAKVLEVHNRDSFEIYGYSIGPASNDDMRQRLIKAVDVFDDVGGMSDQNIAMLARQDKLDIAIDLTGYTKNNRFGIFSYRLAPVQINYLGFSGTMGAEFMDYIIADPVLVPAGSEQYYSESLLRLPYTFMPTDNTRPISTRLMTRSEMGLPETGFVFCCFNNSHKVSSNEFDIWMRILLQVEESVLWLGNLNTWAKDNLRRHAKTRGVDPMRLVFADRLPIDEHLARQKLADLFLDTFFYNAHTSASEALWAGLPVVTKAGKGFAARAAASLLTAAGLPELIVNTEVEYEMLILNLANNPTRLGQIRQTLMDNRETSPLFDTELFTKHLENGYQQVYQRHYDGKQPKTVLVAEN
jgi:protein O-GlcNAc transferase